MIEIKNLLKVFNKNRKNEVRAIDNMSIQFPEKGLVAIYGMSGSGKTTLMNALGGLDKFDSGQIIMDGNVYKKSVSDKYRIQNIGYIFQNYLLDEKLDVYQNVAQGLRTEGIKDEEVIFKRVMIALDNVGMRNYFKRNVTTLSGGQQQRVAIARAMVKGAKIILADEPTGNLDENNTRNVMEILKAISKNCLVIVVTHEGDLIDKYADSVIEIKDGKVESLGEKRKEEKGSSDKTMIFLGDKSKSKIVADNIDIDYYGEPAKVRLTIVNEKGRIYLKAVEGNITLLGDNAETKLIDSTRNDYIADKIEKTSLAIKQLGAVEGGKTGSIFSFGNSFASGVKSLIGKKKKRFTITAISVFILMIAVVIMTGVLGGYYYEYKTCGEYIHTDLIRVTIDSEGQYEKINEYIESKGYDVEFEYVWGSSMNFTISARGFQSFTELNTIYTRFVFNDINDTKNMNWVYRSADNIHAYDDIVISSGLADDILNQWFDKSNADTLDYDILYNTNMLLLSRQVRLAGIVEEDDYKIYINDIIGYEMKFDIDPDIRYGLEIPYDEVYVPVGSLDFPFGDDWMNNNDDKPKTTIIYGKEFKVVESDKVKRKTLNCNELRKIAERCPRNFELHIVTPQADELSINLYEEDIVRKVSSRMVDNKNLIYSNLSGIYLSLFIDSLILVLLFVLSFFMFSASLTSKLKEIGLYRAIGVSAKNIFYKFFVESLAFVVLPIVAIYLLIGLPILLFSTGHILYLPVGMFFMSFGIMAVGMILVSILPILFYIRKTPVQILSKYDL